MARADRCIDVLSHAGHKLIELGGFPLPFEQVAAQAGVSKVLVYHYFPTQFALGNAMIEEEYQRFDLARLRSAMRLPDLHEAARACATLYFDYVAERGVLLHMLLADAYLARGPDRAIYARISLLLLPAVRRLRKELAVTPREAAVVMQLLLSIPEEAGRKAKRGEVPVALARKVATDTLVMVLEALRNGTPDDDAVPAYVDFL